MDCTLRELTSLIKEVNPDARRKGTTFDFSLVQADRTSGRYNLREVGNTMNGQRGIDDNKTVSEENIFKKIFEKLKFERQTSISFSCNNANSKWETTSTLLSQCLDNRVALSIAKEENAESSIAVHVARSANSNQKPSVTIY